MINNIKKLRKNCGLTQETIAQQLGINQSTVSMWEKNRSMPRANTIYRLAEILKCSIDDIFNERNGTDE